MYEMIYSYTDKGILLICIEVNSQTKVKEDLG